MDAPAIKPSAEDGAPAITCPHCLRSWVLTEQCRKDLQECLETWDRRFDRSHLLVMTLLDVIEEHCRQQKARGQ
jgi:hypothetical protein